jgi:ADP-ribosylation factor GTPase-activating protein 1
MDAFKQAEILRMQYGGNKAWQDFYNKNTTSLPFDEATIKERYDSEVGEEWKERLSCQVEDRVFDKEAFQKERQAILQKQASRSATPAGGARQSSNTAAISSTGSGPGSRTASPAPKGGRGISVEQKAQNEAYFARMGEANASRPDGLPPSQGGKYGGFGSSMPEPSERQGGGIADDFSKDPVGAITKGFGWFGGMVSKQAKMVNDSYIQPTAKNVSILPAQLCTRRALLTVFL